MVFTVICKPLLTIGLLCTLLLGSSSESVSVTQELPSARQADEARVASASSPAHDRESPPGIPHLSEEEIKLLHALFGGIGPVILPPDSSESDNAVEGASPHQRVTKREIALDDTSLFTPEQIHIAYGDGPTEMVIMWSTWSDGSSEVTYGLAPNNFSSRAEGNSVKFVDWYDEEFQAVPFIHRVKLKNLIPGATYSYKVETEDVSSQPYTFNAMKDGTEWSPTLLVYGDMGSRGGAPSLKLLRRAARQKSVDAILHVGDFAYDLHDEGGKVGDDFMNRIQSVAAELPYMTCVGNHEIPHDFAHYRYRFSMPGHSWPTRSRMWYSFDMGKVHFVAYSTEVYFIDNPYRIIEQMEWLQADLQKANGERAQRPWIIAFGHRPMYCSNADRDDCTREDSRVRAGLEDIFYEQGVDLIIQAHEHSYERFWPMYRGSVTAKHYINSTAPVHVISGAAGCDEFHSVCVNPMFGPRGEWSAHRSWLPGLYGIGRLHIANETHLHWQQRLAVNDQVQDEFWLEQNTHGPFTLRA
ncbi:acid phosphatase type 7-like [Diadema antillarum]|uniref:acid phosphatase type 7-like n=1 Tax=Diadema antillarum TaxID=105358 RepID=UPI003A896B53